ncbi:MAG: HypC/HybG/HupF family hydrogenase formation chaperone [Burkholderiales bacterium]|nr:HypC/HybG/HupF family hydrogenase formation chaperone [Burkholderiales bacterium]
MCLAVPGRIRRIRGDSPLERSGEVEFGGVAKEASLAFVPEAQPGDWVLVHAGVAIAVLDPAAAERALDALRALEAADGGAP